MNRAERRAKHHDDGRLLHRIDGGCDDCGAYSDLVDHGGGLLTLEIRHDSTCPALARIEGRRG